MKSKQYSIIRTYSAGVFAGYIKTRKGKEAVITNARRLWYWSGAASLSELSLKEQLIKILKKMFPKKHYPDLTLENKRNGDAVRVTTENPSHFSTLIISQNQVPVLKSILENSRKAGKK